MIINAPSDIAFSVFNFPIYWYGIILAVSILVGFYVADYLSQFRPVKSSLILDNAVWFIIVGLLGARVYYCLLIFSYYALHPLQVFDLRQGGLSIHGMLIAGFLFVFFLCKKNKLKILPLLDVIAASVPLSQAIGRWGNYFNSEAFGIPTYSNWGLFVPIAKRPENFIDYSLFHPTFLYESVLNFLIFILLWFLIKKSKTNGVVFSLYLILYSIARIIVEQIRIDSALDLFGFPIAQIISLILILFGLLLMIKKFDF